MQHSSQHVESATASTPAPRVFVAALVFSAGWFIQPAIGQSSDAQRFRETRPVSSGRCPADADLSLVRPLSGDGPTIVGVGVYISDLIAIDDVRQSIQLDAFNIFRWLDPRLADPLRGEVSVACHLPLDRMWSPPVQAHNLRTREKLYDDIILIDSDGVVTIVRRQILEVAVPLDYREFPFDEQALGISFSAIVFDDTEIVFEALPGVTAGDGEYSLSGWRVGSPSIEVSAEPYPTTAGRESRFTVTIPVSRDTQYWLFKFLFPLVLIVLMSACVFVLPPESNRSQIGIAVTTMLTLIAYQFALAGELPRVSYLTRLDYFTLGSLVLVFSALIKATAVSILLAQGKSDRIARLDRAGRWGFPVAFSVVVWISLLS